MSPTHQIARRNETRPLFVVWASPAIRHGIVADDQTGSDIGQQLGEFQNLACRAVREALKYPVTEPLPGAVHARGQIQLGKPQRPVASNQLLFEAVFPAFGPPPAPDVGKGLEDAHGVLEALIRRPGIVHTRAQLLERCWDAAYEARSNIVDVYIRYLRDKIDRPFGVTSLETIRGAGYRLRKDGGRHALPR